MDVGLEKLMAAFGSDLFNNDRLVIPSWAVGELHLPECEWGRISYC